MNPGIISVFCAIGTVVGLAILVFGMAKKSTTMKWGGASTFVICFVGLILILTKYGERSEGAFDENYEQWRIAKWEQRNAIESGKAIVEDLTKQWDGTIYLIIEEGKARFGDNGKTFLNRGFSTTDSTWTFSVGSSPEAPPLSGTYTFSSLSENEAMLSKQTAEFSEVIWLRKLN